MCITEEKSFVYKDQRFGVELDAVTAALEDIGRKIIQDNAAYPHKGLIEKRKSLVTLLTRWDELNPPMLEEVTSRKAPRGPKVKKDGVARRLPLPARVRKTLDPLTMRDVSEEEVRDIMRDAALRDKAAARKFLRSIGTPNLSDLLAAPTLFKKAYAWANNTLLSWDEDSPPRGSGQSL
jgi:hypothetical protein